MITNNNQVLVLKKLTTFFLFAVNIFGLWPFTFVPKNRQLKYSCFKAFYSVFALCFGGSTYWIIGSYVFRIIRKNYFNSFTIKFVTSVHGYTMLTTFIFVYIMPHIYSRKIEIAFNKCKGIFDFMNKFFSHERIDIWSYLVHIIVKTVVYDIIQAFISLQSYSRSTNISTKIFLLILPPIAVRLHMNVFYGSLIVFKVFFEKLNESLNDIIANAKIICSQSNLVGKYSNRIDEISIIYFRLTEATKLVNAIFSVTITIGHALILVALTIQSLMVFVGLIELVRQGTHFIILQNIFGCVFIFMTFYDLYTTADAAEKLVREANQTALILHKANGYAGVDIRIRRSINIFSARLLSEKFEITECGMLNLNLRIMQMLIATIVSYSVILLQFELADRRNLFIDELKNGNFHSKN